MMRVLVCDKGAVVLLASVLFYSNLGGPRLWDRDEPRNAGCAAEMLASGDWVVPVFNDQLRSHKPVFLYWSMMLAYTLFGVTEFAARFWSATWSIGTVLLTYTIARRLFDRRIGLWSAGILATSMMFGMISRAATPDATLVFFSTLALAIFVQATFPGRSRTRDASMEANDGTAGADTRKRHPFPESWWVAVALYGTMGVAVLVKGPVGLVLPTAVIGMYCLIRRLPAEGRESERGTGRLAVVGTDHSGTQGRTGVVTVAERLVRGMGAACRPFLPGHFLKTCWSMRPITAVTMVALVAGPWYAWVGYRTGGAWLAGFLGEHNLGRALVPMEGHGGPVFYYIVAILVAMFPWSVVAIPTALYARVGRKTAASHRAAILFLTCWVLVYVGLFTLARTKLPSYIAPTFPALAILIGVYLVHFVSVPSRANDRWMATGLSILTLVGVILAVGLYVAGERYFHRPMALRLALVGLVPCCGGIGGLWFLTRGARTWIGRTMLATAAAQSVLAFAVVSVAVSQQRSELDILAHITSDAGPPQVASFRRLEPSWVFYSGHSIRAIGAEQLSAAIDHLTAHPNPYLITTRTGADEIANQHPLRIVEVAVAQRFLKDDQLVLLAPDHPRLAEAE